MTPADHLRAGLRYGFPRCCVARFVLGSRRGETNQAVSRGVCKRLRDDGSVATWVPCRPGAHGGRPFFRTGAEALSR